MNNSKIGLIDALAGELMILRLPDGPRVTKLTREEALENAQKIVRELFPPMAKPLVWVDDLDGHSYGSVDGATLCECGVNGIGENFAHYRPGNKLYHVKNRKKAKAACESHHQARFLEMVA